MSVAPAGLHESAKDLSARVLDQHRAIASLMEELEAVDWYGQRIAATGDEELRRILEHNRSEEIEHAAMLLEWLRRHDEGFDRELGNRLFRAGPIVRPESEPDEPRDLRIGSLRLAEPDPTEEAPR